MKAFTYYARADKEKETLGTTIDLSRLAAAKSFAKRKNLPLKAFLTIFALH